MKKIKKIDYRLAGGIALIVILAVGALLVGGNNQPAKADTSSLKVAVSEITDSVGQLKILFEELGTLFGISESVPEFSLGGSTGYDQVDVTDLDGDGSYGYLVDGSSFYDASTGITTLGDEDIKWEQLDMPAGANEICQQFTATTTIDLASMGADYGTASSTYGLAAFATTSSSISNNYDDDGTFSSYFTVDGVAGSQSLFAYTSYATSTNMGTTTTTAITSIPNGELVMRPNAYLCLYMNLDDLCFQDGHCEKATSTSRGFDPWLKVRTHR